MTTHRRVKGSCRSSAMSAAFQRESTNPSGRADSLRESSIRSNPDSRTGHSSSIRCIRHGRYGRMASRRSNSTRALFQGASHGRLRQKECPKWQNLTNYHTEELRSLPTIFVFYNIPTRNVTHLLSNTFQLCFRQQKCDPLFSITFQLRSCGFCHSACSDRPPNGVGRVPSNGTFLEHRRPRNRRGAKDQSPLF